MSPLLPRALPENQGLAFSGERVRATAAIPTRLAERMLGTRNPHGQPNANVLRRFVSATHASRMREQWQVDFPPEMGEQEASLYEHPFHHLYRAARESAPRWWINPHANPALRAAVARLDRYLALPVGAGAPEFAWLESTLLPDDSLLVVARDDDFTHGVLRSRVFAVWWRELHSRRTPTRAIDTFPFPWPPRTPLSALTREQEDHRHAVARAARGGAPEALDAAVTAAYGWPAGLADGDLLVRLRALNAQRAG